MNVFNFDGTVYKGDSSIDFWLFCASQNVDIIKFLPHQINGFFLYIAKKISKEEFKSHFFSFINGIDNLDLAVNKFWDKNGKKIKTWYAQMHKDDDCIVSASPKFLLKEICKRLGINHLIATEVDKHTGKIIGKNCYGKNKVGLFKEKFKDVLVDNFYSDSKSDLPMARLAKKAFFVSGNKISAWEI